MDLQRAIAGVRVLPHNGLGVGASVTDGVLTLPVQVPPPLYRPFLVERGRTRFEDTKLVLNWHTAGTVLGNLF